MHIVRTVAVASVLGLTLVAGAAKAADTPAASTAPTAGSTSTTAGSTSTAGAATPAKPAAGPAASAAPQGGGCATAEASQRYNRGVELYSEGDYKLALIEFQRAYDLCPNYKVLYNIGEVHFQLNNYSSALKALERYLAEGRTEIPGKRRLEVEKDIETLKSRTARLTISVTDKNGPVEGAEVLIDDNTVGKSPTQPNMLVDAGPRKITINKPGYASASKSITLAGGDNQSVSVQIESIMMASAQPQKVNYTWIAWGATGVLAAGAVVTGIMTMGADDDLKNLKGKQGVSRQELDDADSKRKGLALATDILAGCAIVGAGVATYLTIKGNKEGANVQVGMGPGTAHLVGRF